MIERMWGHLKNIPIRGHLNSPKELFSPLSLLLIITWLTFSYLIIFNWSLWQFGGLMLVDRISVLLIAGPAFRYFYSQYPEYKTLIEKTPDEINELEIDAKYVSSIQRFPQRFSFLCLMVGFIKCVPGAIYIFSQWDFNRSLSLGISYFLLLMMIAMVHGYGCQFMELHVWATKYLKELSQKYDLKSVFSKVEVSAPSEKFFWAEVSSYLTILVSLFICMGLAFTEYGRMNYSFFSQYMLLIVSSLFLLAREFYLYRMYFFGGISGILTAMNDRSFIAESRQLPLHSSEHLAKFEQVFNKMNTDLREKISEVERWSNYATAKTRIQVLGETSASAIIAHDLAGPIHSIKLFMDELKHNPEQISKSPELITRMDSAIAHCEQLIRSLRSSLKDSNLAAQVQQTSVIEIFKYAKQSVHSLIRSMDELKIGSRNQIQISFEVEGEPAGTDALVSFSKLDGIHVLTNLLNNAAQELLAARVDNPFIAVKLRGINSETLEIRIIDNGRGLNPEDFEALTSDVNLFSGHFASVGLHLIRRMIEQRGGSIWVEAPKTDSQSSGTVVVMRLAGRLIRGDLSHEAGHLDS